MSVILKGPRTLYRHGKKVVSMQRFVAELSSVIDNAEFARSWHGEPSISPGGPKVEFVFAGRRVSAAIHSDPSNQWPSASFRQSFSAAIRRLDRACNIRWI